MSRRSFAHRAEAFGFDKDDPWALDTFRLLFHVPRAYEPLVRAWDRRHPGTLKALERLAAMGFVSYQPGVIVDTRTGELADRPGRRVARYRTTSRGKRLVQDMREDIRVLEDTFSFLTSANTKGVARLLRELDLEDSHAKFGLSITHAVELSGLPTRTGRWWIDRLTELGFLRELDVKYADVREVVPAHWRVTRLLCRQLADVIDSFPATAPEHLKVEFRLGRTRFLSDLDPARVGISGATDFDHDIECQQILAGMLDSPLCATGGIFAVEPRRTLPVDTGKSPWAFNVDGDGQMFYQPDAELREYDEHGRIVRSVIEYERYQTRRDAWNHIQRFLGYLHTFTLPFEPAVLRFVVDSEARVRSYVPLIEAFCDYAMDHSEQMPANPVVLAVSSAQRLSQVSDPLDPGSWFRISLPRGDSADTEREPVVHAAEDSPYDEYFARS